MRTLNPPPIIPRRESRSEYAASQDLQATIEARAMIDRKLGDSFNHDMQDDMIDFSIGVNWEIL